MKFLLRAVVVVIACILPLSGLSSMVKARSSQSGLQPDFEKIDAFVQEKMQADAIPGLAYAIVDDGKIVHIRAFGVAGPDGAAMTPQTPMIIASVGKTFTALAVRQLINAGKLAENAPVQHYIPWFRLADPQASGAITVRQLLEHTSGISTLAGNNPAMYVPGASTEELVRGLKDVALDRPVGSSFEYSNINYLVLGLVIEAASGMPYEQYVQQNIYAPLEMRHSYFSIDAGRAGGMGSGYRYYFGLPLAVDVPFPSQVMPAGMHINSTEDMAHYLIAFSNHGFFNNISVVAPGGSASASDSLTYNIDWILYTPPSPGDTPGHSGGWLNYSSGLYFMPVEQMGVVLLANAFPTQWLPAQSTADIALDVVRLYTGNSPAPAAPTLPTLYLIVDAVLVLLAGLVVFRTVRLRGWRRSWLAGQHRGQALTAMLGLDLLVPLFLLLGLPVLFASLPGQIELSPFKNWARILFTTPDLGAAWLVLAAALLGVGLVKLTTILKISANRS